MRALDPQDPAITSAAVLDALPIMAWMANPQGDVTFVSRGWTRFSGIDGDVVVANGYVSIVHPDDVARVVATWEAAIAAGTHFSQEMRLAARDGTYQAVLNAADPVRGPNGEIAGWFGIVTDLDRLQVAESALAAAREAAEESAGTAAARAAFSNRLMDAVRDCIKVLALDGTIVSVNESTIRVQRLGSAADAVGTSWLDAWPDEDRPAARAALATARRGEGSRFTGRLTLDGRPTWWDVTVSPIPDAAGRPEHLLVISRDVTRTELANRTIAQSEARFRVMTGALPGLVWSASPAGDVEILTESPTARKRFHPASPAGDDWLEAVHPADRSAVRAQWSASLTTGADYDAVFRIAMQDGTYRWQIVRAVAQRDDRDEIVRWFGFNLDIDDRRRADEARDQLARLVEASDDLIGIADEGGRMTFANAAMRHTLAIPHDVDIARTHRLDFFVPDDRRFVEQHIEATLAREGSWLGEARFRNLETGATVPVWFNTFALHDDAGAVTGIATIARDLRERRRIEIGMRALAEAGAAMYGSLDVEATTLNVTAAVANNFASWCSIELLEPGGSIRTLAATHREPALQPVLDGAIEARNFTAEHPAVRAIRSGESTLMTVLPDDWYERIGVLQKIGPDDVRLLDTRSVISVPIRSARDNHIFGSLTCAIDGRDQRGQYAADDVRFAEEIAVRAALAFDHARSYERERRIAVTLQAASLPGTLPTVDHLYLSADYRPGKSEATIGGDWYDAFPLDDGRIVITIGDVLGNGLNAAVTMGKVRQAMQSVAMVVPDPNTMLKAADRTVRAHSNETYATALAGIFDPATHVFTFASAGHPGPVLRATDGTMQTFDAPGVLLGLRSGESAETFTIRAMPGTSLVFFTDGLIEATRDIDEGMRRLYAAFSDPEVEGADNPAAALVERVLEGRPATDDIAVLVAEIGPSARFDARLRSAETRAVELGLAGAAPGGEATVAVETGTGTVVTLPARLTEIAAARRAVRTLLAANGVALEVAEAAELAAGELVANAMEHGCGAEVTLAVRLRTGVTVLAVTNAGSPFVRNPVDLRHIVDRERGRGLEILSRMGWELVISSEEADRCTVTASLRHSAFVERKNASDF